MNNWILFPVGVWLGFKVTKTSFLGSIVGWFSKSPDKQLLTEARLTIVNAKQMSPQDQKSCAAYVITRFEEAGKQFRGLPAPSSELDEIMKSQITRATNERQDAALKGGRDSDGRFWSDQHNPLWIRAALFESMLFANSGKFSNGPEILNLIVQWTLSVLSKEEFDRLVDE